MQSCAVLTAEKKVESNTEYKILQYASLWLKNPITTGITLMEERFCMGSAFSIYSCSSNACLKIYDSTKTHSDQSA